jgi:hypothetical protein
VEHIQILQPTNVKIVTTLASLVLAKQKNVVLVVNPHTIFKITHVLKLVQMDPLETQPQELVTHAKKLVKLAQMPNNVKLVQMVHTCMITNVDLVHNNIMEMRTIILANLATLLVQVALVKKRLVVIPVRMIFFIIQNNV